MNILFAQFFAVAAMLIMVFSVQCRKKKHMMTLQMISHLLYSTQYGLLKAYSAGFIDIISVLRCLAFYKYDKNRTKIPKILPIIFVICILIIGYFTYDGLLSVVPIAIGIAYTIGAAFKNPKVYKVVFGLSTIIWFFYNLKVQAYVCLIGNVLEAYSTFNALYREKKNKHKKKRKHSK